MYKIKVGVLISYDYELIKNSIPLYYDFADAICLAIDSERKTWAGESFEIDDKFFDWVRTIDTQNKITFYEDKFFIPDLSPIECDTRERNLLADFMGKDGWHIHIDVDEYFVDFQGFVSFLKNLEKKRKDKLTVAIKWKTIFKRVNQGFLIVNSDEMATIATNNPHYRSARLTCGNQKIISGFEVIHQSWAREESEIRRKLYNWGHTDDFNPESYFKLWKAIDQYNYKCLRNFHPLNGNFWNSLSYVKAENVEELLTKLPASYRSNSLNRISIQKFLKKYFLR